jgi:hypothetical protein
MTGNDIRESSGINPNTLQNGILLTHGNNSTTPDADVACYDISGNTIANFNPTAAANVQNRIRLNERFHGGARWPGYAGANNDNPALQTYLQGRNTAVNYAVNNNVAAGGTGNVGGAPCSQPVTLP